MNVKGIKDEDFVNYKKPSMFICSTTCDWKCCIEASISNEICQNHELKNSKIINIPDESIYDRYIKNDITKSIVIGGLEPMIQFEEVYNLIKTFRDHGCNDIFIIYTGYYPNEIDDKLSMLKTLNNIIVKFGRFIPNYERHFDDVLGIRLASDNQYAEKIC